MVGSSKIYKYDFLKYRWVCLGLSVALIVGFFGTCIYKERVYGSAFTYSVDFTGGTQVLMKFDKPVTSAEVKQILSENGWARAVTRDFPNQEILIRVSEYSTDATGLAENMRQALEKGLRETKVNILENETVGAGVGAELRYNSLKAILIALVLMLIYIAWRFKSFSFAAGAVFALFHDALMMLLAFLLFDREVSINVIGAILAVLGYSINDTIVIFSQIRHNLKELRGTSLYDIINISINQTLRRTILTSLSTALTVGAMFVLGGEALRDFSMALLVGIVFGTYSSVYIASSLMMLLYKEEK